MRPCGRGAGNIHSAAIQEAEMITTITSIEFHELSGNSATRGEELAAWHNRQQLRAFYFDQEQQEAEEIPLRKRGGVVRVKVMAAKWRPANVTG
jgi:hypothetical protein